MEAYDPVQSLRAEELLILLRQEQDKLEELSSILQKAEKILRESRESLDREYSFLCSAGSGYFDPYTSFNRSGCDDLELRIRRIIEELYRTVTAHPVSVGLGREAEAALGYRAFERYSEPAFGISASMTEDGKIIVRLPILGTRWKTPARKREEYGHIFQADTAAAVDRLVTVLPADILNRFREKTLTFFFVYPPNHPRIPDSDNHDTKAVTDAITSRLPAGDAGAACSFYYRTLLTKSLRSATYVAVSPGADTPQAASVLEDL